MCELVHEIQCSISLYYGEQHFLISELCSFSRIHWKLFIGYICYYRRTSDGIVGADCVNIVGFYSILIKPYFILWEHTYTYPYTLTYIYYYYPLYIFLRREQATAICSDPFLGKMGVLRKGYPILSFVVLIFSGTP